MNYNVKPLDGHETKFQDYLNYLYDTYQGRSNHWLESLKSNYKKYHYWTLVFDDADKDIIAFSCIQNHFFQPGTVRILTRTWFDPKTRSHDGALWRHTPVASMAKHQIEWLQDKGYTRAIFTLEPDRGYSLIKFLSKKINKRTGITNFVPQPERMKTFRDAQEKDYQWYAEHLF